MGASYHVGWLFDQQYLQYNRFRVNGLFWNPFKTSVNHSIERGGIERDQWHEIDKGFDNFYTQINLKKRYSNSVFVRVSVHPCPGLPKFLFALVCTCHVILCLYLYK